MGPHLERFGDSLLLKRLWRKRRTPTLHNTPRRRRRRGTAYSTNVDQGIRLQLVQRRRPADVRRRDKGGEWALDRRLEQRRSYTGLSESALGLQPRMVTGRFPDLRLSQDDRTSHSRGTCLPRPGRRTRATGLHSKAWLGEYERRMA